MTNPAVDVLLDVRALLARPGGWIQGREEVIQPDGSVSYCIEGAINAAVPPMQTWSSMRARERVESVVDRGIPWFNDAPTTTQADVLAVIDRAIQAEWRRDPLPPRSLTSGTFPTASGTFPTASRTLEMIMEEGSHEPGAEVIVIPFPDRTPEGRRSHPTN
jgi:hypothetical protein